MWDDPDTIKKRIEAVAVQAQMNAHNHGGDNATAAADLMCAFVLIAVKSGADPEEAKAVMWSHAKTVVADFWPNGPIN